MSELQQISQWMEGLTHCGLYYEGYTDDVQQMLTMHSTTTVTTYGVRRSHIYHRVKVTDNEKENSDSNATVETQTSKEKQTSHDNY